ncbi:uncharacterized protein BYT42DRAFT_612126 [Radiomyces spectabilis]|uniref:uncharacterized protein n=1 Tax=Radiomyces spectabilis TaxID=64574 RepID=UPI00221EFA9D|nr:uncharacterized protein BYT42DRAFT_612126 [Radiomyces spectabilis]KAI8384421.1 hypothetical protein BYT42DRAFT_612126 [Radiomyces spectabilis]
MNKRLIAVLVSCIPLARVFQRYHSSALQVWKDQLWNQCQHGVTDKAFGQFRASYTGWTLLDQCLCVSVNTYQHALRDVVGLNLTRVYWGVVATVLVIMAIEGSRRGASRTVLAWLPVFGLLMNVFGVAAVTAFIWMPCYFLFAKFNADVRQWTISPSRTIAIVVSMLITYAIPALLTTLVFRTGSPAEQNSMALVQVAPLLMWTLYGALDRLLARYPSPVDTVADPVMKEKLKVVEGKDFVERTYLLIGGLNLIVYYIAYMHSQLYRGVLPWDAVKMLLSGPDNVFVGQSVEVQGQFLTSAMVFGDLAILTLSLLLWVLLEDGIKSCLVVAVGSVLLGPGAAISFYAAYREHRVQDSSKLVVKKD